MNMPTLPGERWAEVPGSNGTYYASTEGRIYSVPRERTRGGIVKQHVGPPGYPRATVVFQGTRQKMRVYRIVAETFLGPAPERHEVRHLNGDCMDSRLENLAYGTHAENMRDMIEHGRTTHREPSHCPSGHEMTPENTRYYERRGAGGSSQRPYRKCRKCETRRQREWARRKRARLMQEKP